MFLPKVYSHNRFLFYLFLFFCVGQSFFIYKGVENAPFFLYGMYSAVQVPTKEYKMPIIEINGQEFNLNDLPAANREMIVSTLELYSLLENTNFRDTLLPVIANRFQSRVSESQFEVIASRLTNNSRDKELYQQWLKKYLEQTTETNIKTLQIFTGRFTYDKQSTLHLIDKQLLFEVR